jgi:ATP adenylyltransferase
MDHLWTPWRASYIKGKKDHDTCVFCHAASSTHDEETLVIHRAHFNFVILNRYPYTSGHLMIAPYQHVSRLQQADAETVAEMMGLARLAECVIQQCYLPQGINIGMNLGEAAGAGIEQHIHMHVLPRWFGDANFMTSVSNTRIIPEELAVSFGKLRRGFNELGEGA